MPTLDATFEHDVRRAVFSWLASAERAGQSVFTLRELVQDFAWQGSRLPLADRHGRGIHSPAPLQATLSVLSSWRSVTELGYHDSVDEEAGVITYSYEGREGGTNIKLQRAAAAGIPIVYFRAIGPSQYAPYFPVRVEDLASERVFRLHMDEVVLFQEEPADPFALERSYIERTMWSRVHQPAFRGMVMQAYQERCAVCSFAHPQLLDAAHILSDRHERGVPATSNGLSLCKMHHSAYDRNFLGIGPDLEVVIPARLLAERDGPMLRHGLQEMHGHRITVPSRPADQPNRGHLAERFEAFTAANA